MATSLRFADAEEVAGLRAFHTLSECNPFLRERVEAERVALGDRYIDHGTVWHVDASIDGANPNVPRLNERAEALSAELRERLARGARATPEQLAGYRGLVFYVLFERFRSDFFGWMTGEGGDADAGPAVAAVYGRYRRDFEHLTRVRGANLVEETSAPHMFALGYQIRRAFHHTYRGIYGGSLQAARLRAAVWESIFTRDAGRYRRGLYTRMADIPTLVWGASGTGKELVARAVGLSGYVAFDESRKRFAAPAASLFQAVNLSALPSALIESELFGHRRGSFTGALEDRVGWLESCPAAGTIFLDEIGELEPALQTKLLRVVQERVFQRVGETRERRFAGRIVTATNRDLGVEMQAGRFRADLYYRICADVIRTPTLAEQLAAAPDELANLVLVLARRAVPASEADALAAEVVAWIDGNLGRDYGWPGNVRELEQCLRNVLVRGSYQPPRAPASASGTPKFLADVEQGALTAAELLSEYCTRVYHRVGSYEAAARQLELDRRTVKGHVDAELLARLRSP
jgi:transcriptional regulator with AAA-type ATPase domain